MLRLRSGSTQIGTYSMGGIHGAPNSTLVTSRTISSDTMPSQNDGVAMPPTAKMRTTTSIQVFCLSAEMAPRGMAMAMAITVARMAISSEMGRRAQISLVTGAPDHMEGPKSRRRKAPTKTKKGTSIGRTMPNSRQDSPNALGSDAPPP